MPSAYAAVKSMRSPRASIGRLKVSVPLTALCDSFFPRIMIRRRRPVPIGTVSLSTCFHADAAALAALGTQHVLGVARALNFHGGYFDQRAEVWSRDGALLASSQQMVYFKE